MYTILMAFLLTEIESYGLTLIQRRLAYNLAISSVEQEHESGDQTTSLPKKNAGKKSLGISCCHKQVKKCFYSSFLP